MTTKHERRFLASLYNPDGPFHLLELGPGADSELNVSATPVMENVQITIQVTA
jgi:hypothetical protein